MPLPYLTTIADGVELRLLVVPRASRSRLIGEHGGQLKIQLAAPPVDGEANRALLDFFATLVKLPKSQLELVSGETGRRKRLRLHGIDASAFEAVMKASS